jgi:hypothetical protein
VDFQYKVKAELDVKYSIKGLWRILSRWLPRTSEAKKEKQNN